MSRVIQSERLNLSLLAAAVLAAVAAPAPSHAWNDLQVPETDAGVFDPREGPVLVDYRLLMDADELEVLVVDFSGRVIERMSFVELRAGDHEFEWGGCDENGEMLPNGRYRLEIRAVFEDGHTEKEDVEVRIASIPEKRLMPPPEPLPREEPFYRIDGTLSTFWRRDSQDPENMDESGEHRAWTRLRLKGEGHRAEGIFSMRRPYSGRASYEGSSAMAEKSWEEGRIKGVFRQGLGRIDDPMKLFSDFRTERKKVGGRLDHRLGRLDTTILGFTAEGGVENRERGGALRIGLDAARGIRMGLTLTGRSRRQERGRRKERDRAAAIDLAVPIGEGTDIEMEAVGTKNPENIGDDGWMLGVKHDSGALRASAGYYYLGEDFSAPFADPLRRVYSNARGLVAGVDFARPEPLWVFDSVALSARGFSMERPGSGEALREGEASVRLRPGKKNTILFRWLRREDGEWRSSSFMAVARRTWSEAWSTTLQVNTAGTRTSETLRGVLAALFQRPGRLLRISLERARRVIESLPESPYEETEARVDLRVDPLSACVSARRNHRKYSTGLNLFGRLALEPEFLHRYRVTAYLALGNRAAFETEKQVELGLELRF